MTEHQELVTTCHNFVHLHNSDNYISVSLKIVPTRTVYMYQKLFIKLLDNLLSDPTYVVS